LQKDVVAALVRSGYAALSSIGCEVNGERVILFGAVPTYHLKQLAQVFAQRVDGVGKVVNRIAVFA
jgi:osmotically-inducible protein OsmY